MNRSLQYLLVTYIYVYTHMVCHIWMLMDVSVKLKGKLQ